MADERLLHNIGLFLYAPREVFAREGFFKDIERPPNYHQRKDSEDNWIYLIHRKRWGANPRGVRRLPEEGLGWQAFTDEFSDDKFTSDPEYRIYYEQKALDSILKAQVLIDSELIEPPVRLPVVHKRRLAEPPRTTSVNSTVQFFDMKETVFYYASFHGENSDIELGEGITEGVWAPESDLVHHQLHRNYCAKPAVEGILAVITHLRHVGVF